jgi:hypothetical protein
MRPDPSRLDDGRDRSTEGMLVVRGVTEDERPELAGAARAQAS